MDDIGWLLAPFAAGLLVMLTHVPLGIQVLRRGIVFSDLAIAQLAALGVLLVGTPSGGNTPTWLPAGTMALAGAGLVAWFSRAYPDRREALIGLVYVAGAVLALIRVSTDPRGAQELASVLSGDVLWVAWPDLLPLATVTLPLLAAHLRWPSIWAHSVLFYPCFAVLVSLSVPLLGLYLVFTTLIVPALPLDRHDCRSWVLAVAGGMLGYGSGLLMSFWWDLPSGPAIVLSLMAIGAIRALAAGRLTVLT